MSEVIPAAAIDAVVAKGRESKLYISRKYAQGLLEAAAPYMLAAAFEAAADELDGKRLLTKPFHEYYPEWLRARANELKTNNPYGSQS